VHRGDVLLDGLGARARDEVALGAFVDVVALGAGPGADCLDVRRCLVGHRSASWLWVGDELRHLGLVGWGDGRDRLDDGAGEPLGLFLEHLGEAIALGRRVAGVLPELLERDRRPDALLDERVDVLGLGLRLGVGPLRLVVEDVAARVVEGAKASRMTSSQPSPKWRCLRRAFRTRPVSLDLSDSPDGGWPPCCWK
jgi:hypothetical protein